MYEIGRGNVKSLFSFVVWFVSFLEDFQFVWQFLWNNRSYVTKASFEMPSTTFLITYPTIRGHVVSNIDRDLKQTKYRRGIFCYPKCPDLPIALTICPSVGSEALAPGLKRPDLDREVNLHACRDDNEWNCTSTLSCIFTVSAGTILYLCS
jgi:hypothetical protein